MAFVLQIFSPKHKELDHISEMLGQRIRVTTVRLELTTVRIHLNVLNMNNLMAIHFLALEI